MSQDSSPVSPASSTQWFSAAARGRSVIQQEGALLDPGLAAAAQGTPHTDMALDTSDEVEARATAYLDF